MSWSLEVGVWKRLEDSEQNVVFCVFKRSFGYCLKMDFWGGSGRGDTWSRKKLFARSVQICRPAEEPWTRAVGMGMILGVDSVALQTELIDLDWAG